MIDPREQTYEEWIKDYDGDEMGTKVKATGSGSDFKKVPQGTHGAVCNMVVDLGLQNTTYLGEPQIKPQLYVRWEIPGERVEYEVGGTAVEGPMSIGKTYTASLHEKSSLYKDLIGWRGQSFTPDELEGFNIENILGTHCQLSVTHRESKDKIYANVTGIVGWTNGIPKPAPENELIYYGPDNATKWELLPEWLQKKISSAVGDKANYGNVDDVDIPF